MGAEVKLNRRDPGLDGAPQRPADVRHEREEVNARELARDLSAVLAPEVGQAQLSAQILVELGLLCGVAQVEAGVVVSAELVVDDPERRAVVDEVLAQK